MNIKPLLSLAAIGWILFLIAGGVTVAKLAMVPRGIRNNNPGNIRKGQDWKGETAGADPDFETYADPRDGLRAIGKILLSYRRTGVTSIRAIISRWAPATENDTAAYIAAVSARLGVSADAPVDVYKADVMIALTQAIVAHENGPRWVAHYPQAYYLEGAHRALLG